MVLVLFLLCLINSFTDLNMIWAGTHAEWRGERLLFLVQPRSAWLFIANAIKEIPFYIYCDRYFLITDFQSRDSFCFYFNHNWCGYNYWDIVTTFYTIMYVDKIGVIRLSLFFFLLFLYLFPRFFSGLYTKICFLLKIRSEICSIRLTVSL